MPKPRKARIFVHLPLACLAAAWPFLLGCGSAVQVDQRPNILWVCAEDLSPNLGSYGDAFAFTPNLDRFAGQSLRFTNVFTTAPVCAPSRSAIITGMYATSMGTMHMRTGGDAPYHPENLIAYQAVPPPDVKCFSEYLRAAGYYCVNNRKTDYQFGLPFTAWDESSSEAHWRKRPPGKPFFAVFNLGETHESSNWEQEGESLSHDPAKVTIPPYYPDTPKVRRNLARYYDNIARMDRRFEEILGQLEEDGLADNTIVWFWGDHGAGLPRGKYWLYDSGVRVPLIIRWPETLEPGSKDELISGIDFAPTVLSMLGLRIPDHMQGRAFLGPAAGAPREYVFAAGDRQDETYHRIRSVRDRRYKYIRNYLPEQSYADGLVYKEKMPIMQELRRLAAAGQLDRAQQLFLSDAKPPEELYDLEVDPHEIMNLADSPQHQEALHRLRAEHERWKEHSKDLGAVPETELIKTMWPGGKQPQTQMPEAHVSQGPSEDSVKVRLTCPTEGASIGFATGKDGNPAWQLYAGELTLPRGTTVRARAIRYGYEPSGVIEATY